MDECVKACRDCAASCRKMATLSTSMTGSIRICVMYQDACSVAVLHTYGLWRGAQLPIAAGVGSHPITSTQSDVDSHGEHRAAVVGPQWNRWHARDDVNAFAATRSPTWFICAANATYCCRTNAPSRPEMDRASKLDHEVGHDKVAQAYQRNRSHCCRCRWRRCRNTGGVYEDSTRPSECVGSNDFYVPTRMRS